MLLFCHRPLLINIVACLLLLCVCPLSFWFYYACMPGVQLYFRGTFKTSSMLRKQGGDVMESQSFTNPAGWFIVLYGVGLSFIAAFAPFFGAGYLLKVDVLLAGLSPYLVYAIAVPLLPGAITTAVGSLLAVAHTGLVVAERFIGGGDYSSGLIYTVPIFLAILVTPLVIVAVIKTDAHKPGRRIPGH